MAIPKSKRSGGPKTSSGKLNASKNALKTGAYTAMIVLPGESEEDFQKLYEQFMNDLMPNDVAESAMVYELAGLTWKKLRLEKLEHAAFIRSIDSNLNIKDLADEGIKINQRHEHFLKDINKLDKNLFHLNRDCLDRLNNIFRNDISASDIIELQKTVPLIYDSIITQMTAYLLLDKAEITKNNLTSFSIKINDQEDLLYKIATRETKKHFEEILWIEKNLDQIKVAITKIKEKKLLQAIQEQGLMRSNDDLSRSFFRVLNELRRHQSWRKDMNTVDIYPEKA
jgi:hypothetical protein